VVFKKLDKDGNGTLSENEIRYAFGSGGNKKTTEFFKAAMAEIDTNQDGSVDFEEFVAGL
jgi:Ca2+-binding EF-hand superfamily protein